MEKLVVMTAGCGRRHKTSQRRYTKNIRGLILLSIQIDISDIREIFNADILIKNHNKPIDLKRPLKFKNVEEVRDTLEQNQCENIVITKFLISFVKTMYVDKIGVYIDFGIRMRYVKTDDGIIIDHFFVSL